MSKQPIQKKNIQILRNIQTNFLTHKLFKSENKIKYSVGKNGYPSVRDEIVQLGFNYDSFDILLEEFFSLGCIEENMGIIFGVKAKNHQIGKLSQRFNSHYCRMKELLNKRTTQAKVDVFQQTQKCILKKVFTEEYYKNNINCFGDFSYAVLLNFFQPLMKQAQIMYGTLSVLKKITQINNKKMIRLSMAQQFSLRVKQLYCQIESIYKYLELDQSENSMQQQHKQMSLFNALEKMKMMNQIPKQSQIKQTQFSRHQKMMENEAYDIVNQSLRIYVKELEQRLSQNSQLYSKILQQNEKLNAKLKEIERKSIFTQEQNKNKQLINIQKQFSFFKIKKKDELVLANFLREKQINLQFQAGEFLTIGHFQKFIDRWKRQNIQTNTLKYQNIKLKNQLDRLRHPKNPSLIKPAELNLVISYPQVAFQKPTPQNQLKIKVQKLLKLVSNFKTQIKSLNKQAKSYQLQIKNFCYESLQKLYEINKKNGDINEQIIQIQKKRKNQSQNRLFSQLFVGQVLNNHNGNFNFLPQEIQRIHPGKTIKKTQLIFRYPHMKGLNPHNLLDGKPNYIILMRMSQVKTNSQKHIISMYSQNPLSKESGINNGLGFIGSVTNKAFFYLKSGQKYKSRVTQYNDYYFIFGNSELRWKINSLVLQTNIGHNFKSFDTGHHNNPQVFTGTTQPICQIEEYEIFQILFN